VAGQAETGADRRTIAHPERVIPLAFLIGIAAGTLLLMLPIARADGAGGTAFIAALFTATSALCVTGLTVVDTAAHWSPFGHGVILLLTQVGGFGIMTGATLLGLLVSSRMKLRSKLLASAEMRSLDLGDVRHVVRLVLVVTVVVEAVLALWIAARLWGLGFALGEALWHGLFHAVSAFNNAGFTTLPEGLLPFPTDVLLLTPLMLGVILGGIGFPVLYELQHEWRKPQGWSIHTKLTLWGTLGLTVAGMLLLLGAEWQNQQTLGPVPFGEKLMGSLFHSVMTRSGGFNTHDTAALTPASLLGSTALMLIGAGSASTAGGIRITTFLLLGFVVWSEVKGDPDSVAFRRRIAPEVQRQALAVVLTALGVVAVGIMALVMLSSLPVEKLMFEAASAFATVGLSAGVAPALPPAGQLVLVVLMYVGRVGLVSLAAAIALRQRSVPYRYPEERVLVG
jgi:trk system potassium uptake protein TrkH